VSAETAAGGTDTPVRTDAPTRTERVTIRLDETFAAVLGIVAIRDNRTHREVVERALARYLTGRLRDPRIRRAAEATLGRSIEIEERSG